MKAYDITKVTAELKSDNVQYRNKTFCWTMDVLVLVVVATGSIAIIIGLRTAKVTYSTMIAGRKQVTVRFMD